MKICFSKTNKYQFFVFVFIVLFFSISCGGESEVDEDTSETISVQKINPSDKIYTLDDFKSVGFKKGKSAKKSKLLDGMTQAVWGFWGRGDDALGRGKNQQDYELRFYSSHQEAVDLGIVPADERTGENAKIRSKPPNEATWKELLKEARECQGEGGHHTGACIVPKYGDYIIFGNVVMLCQGATSNVSLENCSSLMNALPK